MIFDELNDDCVYEILKYILPTERFKFQRVTQLWRGTFDQLWLSQRSLQFSYDEEFDHFESYRVLDCDHESHKFRACCFAHLKEVNAVHFPTVLEAVLGKCPNLVALSVIGIRFVFSETIQLAVNRSCPKIEHLEFRAEQHGESHAWVLAPDNVTCLRVKMLYEQFPHLFFNAEIDSLCDFIAKCPKLTFYDGRNRAVNVKDTVSRMPRLQKLSIHHGQMHRNNTISAAETVSNLVNLRNVSLCYRVPAKLSWFTLGEAIKLSQLTELEFLDRVESVSELSRRLCFIGPQLKRLKFHAEADNGCELATICKVTPNLLRLSLLIVNVEKAIENICVLSKLKELELCQLGHSLTTSLAEKLLNNCDKLSYILFRVTISRCPQARTKYTNIFLRAIIKFADLHPKRCIKVSFAAETPETLTLPANVICNQLIKRNAVL